MPTLPCWPRAALTLILDGTSMFATGCDRRAADMERPQTMGEPTFPASTASNDRATGAAPDRSASALTR